MERATLCFDRPGPQNTEQVLELSKKRAQEEDIQDLVIATTSGDTGLKALEICSDFDIIGVSGYRSSHSDPKRIEEFKAGGGKLIYAYEDVDYDYSKSVQDVYLTIAGEGGKVATEAVVAAVRAGLVEKGTRVIGIGGTLSGADTAFLIVASGEFLRLKIQEILCAPYQH